MITDDRKQAVEEWVAGKLGVRRENRLRLPIVAIVVVQVIVVVALGIYVLHRGFT
jgi:hypothetical protein